MKIFRVSIRADKYPTDYTVKASDVSTAVARAIKEWKKRFKGSRAEKWSISVIKGGTLLHETEE